MTDSENEKDPGKSSDHSRIEPVAAIEEAATGTADQPDIAFESAPGLKPMRLTAALVLLLGISAGLFVRATVEPTWQEQKTTYSTFINQEGQLAYTYQGAETPIDDVVPYEQSPLRQEALSALQGEPEIERQWVVETATEDDTSVSRYSLLEAKFHFGFWSMLPAFVAIGLCLVTKESLTSLFSGVVVGAFMLGRFDITDAVLLPNLSTKSAAAIMLLYLWLLGGLLGIWSRTGAAEAFAEFMTRHFVKGPRSAKVVCWLMGVIFFQGGTLTVALFA